MVRAGAAARVNVVVRVDLVVRISLVNEGRSCGEEIGRAHV